MEGGHLVSRPRVLRAINCGLELFVAGRHGIRADSHDRRVPWVPLKCRISPTRVDDRCELPETVVHCVVELLVFELVQGGLAHNEKAERQA